MTLVEKVTPYPVPRIVCEKTIGPQPNPVPNSGEDGPVLGPCQVMKPDGVPSHDVGCDDAIAVDVRAESVSAGTLIGVRPAGEQFSRPLRRYPQCIRGKGRAALGPIFRTQQGGRAAARRDLKARIMPECSLDLRVLDPPQLGAVAGRERAFVAHRRRLELPKAAPRMVCGQRNRY